MLAPLAGIDAAPRGFGGQRAVACLCGALLWALPGALGAWGGAAADAELASPRMSVSGYLALVGCGLLSLVLVASSWGSPARSQWQVKWSRALTLGLGLALGPWAALGYWLEVATHHRPLGAVTYAVGACIVAGVSIALGRWMSSGGPGRRLAPFGWAMCAVSAGTLVLVALRGSLQQPALRPVLADAASGVLLALLIVMAPGLRGGQRAARWGVWMCVAVWVLALGLLLSSADVRATVKSAPIIAGVAGLVLP